MALKSLDYFAVYGCSDCHNVIDGHRSIMAGYPEYYKISYSSGERVLTVCDNPKLMPVLMLKKRKQKPKRY